jgi:hypothetical protein
VAEKEGPEGESVKSLILTKCTFSESCLESSAESTSSAHVLSQADEATFCATDGDE